MLVQCPFNMFQTERISAVKFDTGCEKNMSFFFKYQNLQKFEKKKKKSDWAL